MQVYVCVSMCMYVSLHKCKLTPALCAHAASYSLGLSDPGGDPDWLASYGFEVLVEAEVQKVATGQQSSWALARSYQGDNSANARELCPTGHCFKRLEGELVDSCSLTLFKPICSGPLGSPSITRPLSHPGYTSMHYSLGLAVSFVATLAEQCPASRVPPPIPLELALQRLALTKCSLAYIHMYIKWTSTLSTLYLGGWGGGRGVGTT